MTPINLRQPCAKCNHGEGYFVERNGQSVVYCWECQAYQYNAPKVETGVRRRTVASREGITPSVRARVLASHGHACIACGRTALLHNVVIHLDHLISRAQAEAAGCLDGLIDSEWNLAPMCEECNLGKRTDSPEFIQLIYRVLLIKAKTHQLRETA